MPEAFRRYLPLLISTAAAGALALIAFLQWKGTEIPSAGTIKWITLLGFSLLSIIIAAAANAPNFIQLQKEAGEKREAEEAEKKYSELRERLNPLWADGLDNLLRNRLRHIVREYGNEPAGADLRIYVFARVTAHYQVVASTIERTNPVRRMELLHSEGIIGFTIDREVPVIARSLMATEDGGEVYNLRGEKIGAQPMLAAHNLEKCDWRQKWIFSEPIFEQNPDRPWVNEVLGVLTLDVREEEGRELFLKEEFQREVHFLAADTASYLRALPALWFAEMAQRIDPKSRLSGRENG